MGSVALIHSLQLSHGDGFLIKNCRFKAEEQKPERQKVARGVVGLRAWGLRAMARGLGLGAWRFREDLGTCCAVRVTRRTIRVIDIFKVFLENR